MKRRTAKMSEHAQHSSGVRDWKRRKIKTLFARERKQWGESHSLHVRHFGDVPLGDVAVEAVSIREHPTGRERARTKR